jgi:hypothetical protein
MLATISGIIVLENASPVDGLPSTVCFDGQIWLGASHILTGSFRYYNATNNTFPNIGHYFAWMHVHLLMSLLIFFITLTGRQIHPLWTNIGDAIE